MIGLATGHRVYNYGTRLQAFALQNIVEQMGHESTIINCNRTGKNSGVKRIISNLKFNTPIISDVYLVYQNKKALNTYKRKNRELSGEKLKCIESRYKAFDDFNDKYLKIRQICGIEEDWRESTQDYAAVFCGSDQAWLPQNVKLNVYTLRFASEKTRRISYAPSFGIDYIPENMSAQYKDFLSQMDYISVREQRGKEIVKEMIGRDVPIVLDPTLLQTRDFWENFEKKHKDTPREDYIFCYFLGDNCEHRKSVERISRERGLKIVNLAHMKGYVKADDDLGGIQLYDVSPLEFIGLIKRATVVCTDSFHCTAFSIQYNKEFFAFHRHKINDSASTNSRLHSLLAQFGLEGRIVESDNKIRKEPKIDYSTVETVLNQLREGSRAYLEEALSGLEVK